MVGSTSTTKAVSPAGEAAPATTAPESLLYSASYRALSKPDHIQVYNSAARIDIAQAVNFDSESTSLSATDHLMAALLSDVLLALTQAFGQLHEELMDVEARAQCDLQNPLVLAGVKGIEGVSRISHIALTVYLFTFLDEKNARSLITAALTRAPVYQSLKDALNIELTISFAQ